MLLAESSWPEVEDYLTRSRAVIIPLGSTEQHGPLGLIGTDAMCAERVAVGMGERCGALVTPTVVYTPAAFNLDFPGTVSVSVETFKSLMSDIVASLLRHGFYQLYFLNGHGANIAPVKEVVSACALDIRCRVISWWDYPRVNALRKQWYGAWEGMHATPSEVALTRAHYRTIDDPELAPPEQLEPHYLRDHAGDRHGPPAEHRARFPDGRVGSHSALGTREHGLQLYAAAVEEGADDFQQFVESNS